MKKRVLTILLSALLVTNISACNYELNHDDLETEETTTLETTSTEFLDTGDTQNTTDSTEQNNQSLTPTYSTQALVEVLQLPNIFASVLQNETTVYGSFLDSKENGYLNDFIIGSTVKFAFVSSIDLDENGIKDVVVLEDGDKVIILKEYEGTVYAWQYRDSALYNLRIDGTYNWSGEAGQIYGSAKLQFDGTRRNDVELDRVEYNEKFYINKIEVSQEEYLSYVQNKKLAEKADRYLWQTGFEKSDSQINGK